MEQSLFIDYIEKFFPKLQQIQYLVNQKRNPQLTYLHKTMLTPVYAPDNKWASVTVNSNYVSADVVAMDSPLPIKGRGAVSVSTGELPKVGLKKKKGESIITRLNTIAAMNVNTDEITKYLTRDALGCSYGIDEINEYNFQYGLSRGFVAIQQDKDSRYADRFNFGYFDANQFNVEEDGVLKPSDCFNVIQKAADNGDTVIQIMLDKARYDQMRNTDEAKTGCASYQGLYYTDPKTLPVPTPAVFDAWFSDESGGVAIVKVNRSVLFEQNGTSTPKRPWDRNKVIFLCTTNVGQLVYGQLAEQTNPVAGVAYQIMDTYKLISEYSTNDPLIEFTSGQAFVLPVIGGANQIYSLDVSGSTDAINKTDEDKDTSDKTTTLFGSPYTKADIVDAFDSVGVSLSVKATDAEIVDALNRLNRADKAAVKAALKGKETTITT